MYYNERFYLSMYCGLPKKSVKLLFNLWRSHNFMQTLLAHHWHHYPPAKLPSCWIRIPNKDKPDQNSLRELL